MVEPGKSAPSLEEIDPVAELSDAQKLEIVEALACYRAPGEIIRHFQSEHDLDLTHKQVGGYDPTRPHYTAGDKWRDIFDARRKKYLEDVASHPNANQGYRLGLLQEGIEAAKKAKNWPLVAQLLEQSAKEVGGVLTNERNLKVDDSRTQRARDMTPEDRKLAMAELIRQALEMRAAGQVPVLAPPLPPETVQ